MSPIDCRQSSTSPYSCYNPYPGMEGPLNSAIDIDLSSNERVVSLTMISQKGSFLGFQAITIDSGGKTETKLAGWYNQQDGGDHYGGMSYGYNAESTYQASARGWSVALSTHQAYLIVKGRCVPLAIICQSLQRPILLDQGIRWR